MIVWKGLNLSKVFGVVMVNFVIVYMSTSNYKMAVEYPPQMLFLLDIVSQKLQFDLGFPVSRKIQPIVFNI